MSDSSLRVRFVLDHSVIETYLDRLVEAFETGEQTVARDAYCKFEARLEEHLRVEEELLFPELERRDPKEAAELRAEHAAIRKRVFELGVGVDLHQVRVQAIRELAQALRAHAAREDRTLYRWADEVFSHGGDTEKFFHPPVL